MKNNKLTIEERISIYTQAVETLKKWNNSNGSYRGWCYALHHSILPGTHQYLGQYIGVYDVIQFEKHFPDLLVYAKKSIREVYDDDSGGYLFPCNEIGNNHRIAVLEYRINQLKEQLNKKS